MNKKLKPLVLIALSIVLAASLSGCSLLGGDKAAAGNSGSESTLQKVIKKKKLVVGSILSLPPFGFKDEKGQPQGYDVDIAKEIAKSLNVEIEIVDVTSDARIPSLETGKVDVIVGNFTRTLERSQKVDFSDPYIAAGETLLVKKGSSITNIKDLNGKKVAVTKGSTNAAIVKNNAPTADIVYATTSADAVQMVKNGQAEAFIDDSNFIQYQASKIPELSSVGESVISLEYNSLGVKKGDQDWLNYLNVFVFQTNTNGLNKELYKKWFGTELPYKMNPAY